MPNVDEHLRALREFYEAHVAEQRALWQRLADEAQEPRRRQFYLDTLARLEAVVAGGEREPAAVSS